MHQPCDHGIKGAQGGGNSNNRPSRDALITAISVGGRGGGNISLTVTESVVPPNNKIWEDNVKRRTPKKGGEAVENLKRALEKRYGP